LQLDLLTRTVAGGRRSAFDQSFANAHGPWLPATTVLQLLDLSRPWISRRGSKAGGRWSIAPARVKLAQCQTSVARRIPKCATTCLYWRSI